jgi:hypothetical protein
MSSSWSDIVLEGFCSYSFASKKRWKGYEHKSCDDICKKKGKPTIIDNKHYIPKSKRIAWCKRNNKKFIPCYKCLQHNCPFLGYTEGTIGLRKHIQKYYEVKE